jgi:hypothetical protein
MKRTRTLAQHHVQAILEDHKAGMSLKRIQTRCFVRFNRMPPYELIRNVIAENSKGMPAQAPIALPELYNSTVCSLVMRTVNQEDAAQVPVYRNLYALLFPGGRDALPWHVLRSRFESDGERAYRVIPRTGVWTPFTMWCRDDNHFTVQMSRKGFAVMLDLFGEAPLPPITITQDEEDLEAAA